MKYLFIGAHTDEELCFAGTMIKLLADRHQVDYMAFDYGTSNDEEFANSCNLIGCCVHLMDETPSTEPQYIADWIYPLQIRYDFIFTHSIYDRHPLHRTVAEQSIRVVNGSLATYIGPWNGNEDANYFVELSEEHLEKKIQALACYKSQSHRAYMNPDFIRSWAVYNGIKCGKKYAEGFKVERLIQ
jgi:LmbE family N-acetylglucosaminyl deacetylase